MKGCSILLFRIKQTGRLSFNILIVPWLSGERVHYSPLVIPFILTSKVAVFMSQQSETERRLPSPGCLTVHKVSKWFVLFSLHTARNCLLLVLWYNTFISALPISCHFVPSLQRWGHILLSSYLIVETLLEVLIKYGLVYLQYILGKISYKSVWVEYKIQKRRVYLKNVDKFYLQKNKHFSKKARVQRNKSKSLIVSMFSSFSVIKISKKSHSKVSENFPSIFP